ncbi:hypothetical protein Misp02_28440 [Microtetraspora sp. NBRC 16547]|nr:hypothetical protein Misp02_28440 [Microtetraspora sp. NBRC 16547]
MRHNIARPARTAVTPGVPERCAGDPLGVADGLRLTGEDVEDVEDVEVVERDLRIAARV